ncbi:hypothetical protein [Ralstonia solanacearum]|uniref:hypothetical protein n=1 Tax=Ralstonia solanacearum TaxID=305 RepID=UPI001F1513F0|nr:hypothetical protein [Ralstonia solanacearum]
MINKGDRHASDIIQGRTAPLDTIGSNERRHIDAHTDARFVNQPAAAAQEFAPALGQLIGSKGHTVAGGIYGQMVGSVLGNMLGGATLGAAHYMTEHGVKQLRTAIGRGSEYAPSVSSEAMKQAIFIGTFATFMACKGIAKTATPSQGSVMKDTGMAYALDIAFSAFGGAAAESITQTLAKGFSKIKTDWSWDELKSRVAGGLAAGTVSALGDVNANITEPNADVKGGKWAVAGLGGAINSVMRCRHGSWCARSRPTISRRARPRRSKRPPPRGLRQRPRSRCSNSVCTSIAPGSSQRWAIC